MKHIIKFRWLFILLWIIAAAILTLFTPNLQDLVAEKGQITVPDNYRSKQANKLLREMSDDHTATHDLALVFHQENGLSEEDKQQVKTVIDKLEQSKKELEIKSVIDFTENEEIEETTLSENGKTVMVPIEATTEDQSIAELRAELTAIADQVDVPHALTGESLIEEDIVINSEEGLTKTIYITVVLILIILLLVFRSLIAPIIPLLTVGVSYLVAEGIVSILADKTNFPLSTFTQTFMVAIMFGIGTDYTILIISRFKEEMNRHDSIVESVIKTYKASSKTVFYAALAVLIGFSTIGLSKFTLYQSAVAVAVGVFIVTLAIITIIPFFLVLLGKKLFWPFDKHAEHKESKLWGNLGHFTWTRSFISLAIILVITLPAVLFMYKGEQSYDNLAELSDSYDTVKAFGWIEESFGPGEIMPITVVMELNEAIEDANDFQSIETMSQALNDLPGIEKVRSATRPAGKIIEEFLLEEQTDLLTDGLDEILDGVKQLRDGLTEASDEIKGQAPELKRAQDGVQELIDGTSEIKSGLVQIQNYLKEIEQGLIEGSYGTKEAIDGLQTIKTNLDETIRGHKEILNGYEQLEQGLKEVAKQISNEINFDPTEIIMAVNGLKQSVEGMHQIVEQNDPDLANNQYYLQAYKQASDIIDMMDSRFAEFEKELAKLSQIDKMLSEKMIQPLTQLNNGYREIIKGQEQLTTGLQDLINGIGTLRVGLNEAANGQGQINDNMSPIVDGLTDVNDGQGEIKVAFQELHDGLDELTEGLTEGSDGLGELYDGLDEVNRFISEMDFSNQPEIVVIPDEALDEKDFWDAADLYMSPDRKIIKFDAILNIHPYSKEAMELVDNVEAKVNQTIDKTNFDIATFKIGGIPSMNHDLNDVSLEDYKRTATLMLIGIFIILVILLRSLVMPIYLLASLLLTYYTSLGLSEFLFVKIVGYDGLTWAIPFFSFVMLIALGVDYSIFLMSRFNEYRDSLLYDGMMKTMRNMGTVIISATLILGGTFAAMLPSGVLSLLQIATVVIVGLALYALIILPLLTPIFVKLLGKYNWWPFLK